MQVENLPAATSGAEPEQIDPVCGMTVDPASAAGSHQHGGKTYFFCNLSCLERFKAEPAKFLGGAKDPTVPTAGASDVEYICPMDPEIHQRGPGSCPKCGMALEPAMYTAPPTRTEYTCPMHPEIATPLTLEIRNNRLTAVECSDSALRDEFWEYTHTDENSDRVGEFAIGTNIGCKDVIGNILQDEKIPGIHIAFGNPYGAHTGADWYSSTHIDVVGRNFNIWIDSRQIMETGQFLLS